MVKCNQNVQSYGNEVPLATRQRIPEAVQNILEAWKVKLRRLLDKTSSDKTSSTYERRIHHTTNSAQNAKTREWNGSSQSSMNKGNTNKIGNNWSIPLQSKVSTSQKCTIPPLEKVWNYDRYNIRQPQQSWPLQGCDDPTRIHTLRKYVGQAKDKTGVETVRANQ